MHNEVIIPRFVTRRWARGLGWLIFLAGGAIAVDMICCIPREDNPIMLIITWICAVAGSAAALAGLRILLMPLDKLHVSPDGIRITLFGVTLRRIPMDRLRSVVGSIREYRQGLQDRQIYTLNVYYTSPKGKSKHILMERTDASDEAFRTYLSHLELLL